MKLVRILALAFAACLLAAFAAAQLQECPDTSICSDQRSTCVPDNEGKNCDFWTCQAYCDQQLDECLHGHISNNMWSYPVISRTVIDNVHDGCLRICTAGTCAWDPFACMFNLTPVREYDTHYQEVHTQNRWCDDGYQYDVTLEVIDHPSRTCYEHDESCDTLHNNPPEDCITGGICVFNDPPDTVRFSI